VASEGVAMSEDFMTTTPDCRLQIAHDALRRPRTPATTAAVLTLAAPMDLYTG